jgi:hypothetical protein
MQCWLRFGGPELMMFCARSLCLPKTDFPYNPATPSPGSAAGHSSAFPFHQFGSGFGPFGSQHIACYSSSSLPIYRQGFKDVVIVAPDGSRPDQGSMLSMTGIPTGYGYPPGVLTGQE